jgi:starch synthase (maltosyl-transferring)
MPASNEHIVIEAVRPELNGGRYRAKAVKGDTVDVTADIFRDGTAVLAAVVRCEDPAGNTSESRMAHFDNDRWRGSFQVLTEGRWHYTIEAWTDHFSTWRRGLLKKAEAGQATGLDLEEGALLIERRLALVPRHSRGVLENAVAELRSRSATATSFGEEEIEAALGPEVLEAMEGHPDRTGGTFYRPLLELTVDRERARFGAWYEFFPRSTGPHGSHGTFRTSADHLATVASMGFDVVYLPPIHPIGETHRKGKNNALLRQPEDVGSPWAIGNRAGGHKSVDPNLGSLGDFDHFVETAGRHGIEVALDFAIQCSPDHPWVMEHPEWFHHRPDGSIMYAENPPKKYEDIYPINFDTPDREGLWRELHSVVDFWIAHGITIFRVDNPHTKSFAFWEWLIDEVQRERSDVIFLSEAFTRPKVMRLLAKLGFTQSYTYFTWRNEKGELTDYLEELTQTDMADYFRPNFFTNTQDILTEFLQTGGAPAFKIRFALASLMSPSYGVYSGFEFYENIPLRKGSEEYLDSEKYELRHRSWEPEDGTLIPFIRRINQIRHDEPALALLTNLCFQSTDNDQVLAFSKTIPGRDAILVVISLDPFSTQETTVTLDMLQLGLDESRPYRLDEMLSGAAVEWRGPKNRVTLDPLGQPAQIFKIGAP